MRELSLLVVLSAAGLLAGCARFHAVPLSPAVSAAEFQERSLAAAGLQRYLQANLPAAPAAWPPAEWDLKDLTLAAFYYNPDLDLARAKWATASAGKITADERPNPTLSVTPAYSANVPIPSPWLVTPSLDIPIETAGKRGYRLAQARELSEAARLNIATTAWQVRSKVRRSLLDLYTAREMKAVLQEQQSIQAEVTTLMEAQYAAGAISAFELTQARIAATGARLALRDAESQSAAARVQLADAIGVPVAALDSVQFSFEGFGRLPAAIPASDAQRQALLNRADILGALSEYAASESALQLEIAKQYPDVHLSPGYEFDQGDNKWSLGLSVTLPVLNQNKGAIAEAEAHRTEAAANFNGIQARAVAEIDGALAVYQVAQRKQADADALVASLHQQEKASRAMLEAGEISKSDLAALRLQLSALTLSRLDALARGQQALGQLEDALQSPLDLPAAAWQTAPRIAKHPVNQNAP